MDAQAVMGGASSAQVRGLVASWAATLLGIATLIGPAIWNRFPLLQYDTGGYLARWFEGYLVPSRPGAYGLLLAGTVPWNFWPVVLLQALLVVWTIRLLLRSLGLGGRPWLLLAILVSLSVTTALPWLSSILLTDIFAGLSFLALFLVVFGRGITRWERGALIVLVAFSAATHSATFAVIAELTALIIIARYVRPQIVAPMRARLAALALALGVLLTLGANYVVSARFAFTPGGYGIVFGRMLEDGIVSRYLHDHCRHENLKLCPYRRELPLNADEFLWGKSVFNRLGRFDGLGEEMRTIVLGSLREYPTLQVETALRASLAQLLKVAGGEGVNNQMWHTYGIIQRFTPSVLPAMQAARQQQGGVTFAGINQVHVPVALLTLALLPVLILTGWRQRDLSDWRLLASGVAAAVLVNAFVCGALANPHDRYGTRLIWLAPLTLALAPLCLLRSRLPQPSRRQNAAISLSPACRSTGPEPCRAAPAA